MVKNNWPLCFILLTFLALNVSAQRSFDCSNQVWMLDEVENRIVYFEINASNNAVQFTPFIGDFPVQIDAIAFCAADRFLYGLNSESKDLYRIDADGNIQYFVTLDISPDLDFHAMGFSRSGLDLICIGSSNSFNQSIETVRFSAPNYTVSKIPMPGGLNLSDIVVNPIDGLLYGVNSVDGRIVSLNYNSSALTGLGRATDFDQFLGAFSNPFGEVLAYGSTANGVASALFRSNTSTLEYRILATGPESSMIDFAACPFTVGLYCEVNPKFSFPCNVVEYTYQISNATGRTLDDLRLESTMPNGFKYDDLLTNPLAGDTEFKDERFEVKELELDKGISEVRFTIELAPNLTAGNYSHQFSVTNLPDYLGNEVKSDNPITIKSNDATNLEIKVIDGDTIFQDFFFCITANAMLDGTPFGTEWEWSTGSEASNLQVTESGIYELKALSGCTNVNVVFEVTIASCPYTIDLEHTIEPDSIYPCSTVEYNFIVNNDTGSDHIDIEFRDTLPDGLIFLDILKNPYDGDVTLEDPFITIEITDMDVPDGIDTIICLVEVGDIAPGLYGGRAIISNFPDNLGSFRLSDNPETHEVDSTVLTVLGVAVDTFYQDVILCENETLVLDGTPFGFEYEWFNGSTESSVEISTEGVYELQIFTGCEVSYVFFNVEAGADIDIEIADQVTVFLGDSILLSPMISNEGDSLNFRWSDPVDTTLSCTQCIETYARPFTDVEYTFFTDNQICQDSIRVKVLVDNTRRLYTPNVFSLNASAPDDRFSIQTPDFAKVLLFHVYDRYGNLLYENNSGNLDDIEWRGTLNQKLLDAGVYIWKVRLEFLDGLVEDFAGSVLFLK